MPTFRMNTPTGRRLQLQECLKDIDIARGDVQDEAVQKLLATAAEALHVATRLMKATEPAPHWHEWVAGRCVHCGVEGGNAADSTMARAEGPGAV